MIRRGTQGRRVSALDVPYERDVIAQLLVACEGVDLHTIARAYGVTHESVRLVARRADASFARAWRRMYGTECPWMTHRDWRGGRNVEVW
jgi:hypothetical protein